MEALPINQQNIFLLRKKNVWYTMQDGNWSNPDTWLSNALDRKNITVPQAGDDVYINHNVTMDLAAITINNLYVSGTLTTLYSPVVTLTVNGDCQVSGSGLISLLSDFHNLVLNGYNNIIPYAGFNAGAYSTVTYNATVYHQAILNLPYHSLTTQNGQKYQTDDVTVGGTFTPNSNYECGAYNLTVNGTSAIGNLGVTTFSKSGGGNLLFVGNVDFEGSTDWTGGNPNVEFRGGIKIHTFGLNVGTGIVSFTTNNQSIECDYFNQIWTAPIAIQGAITVTLSSGAIFNTNSTINGTLSSSTFNNTGVLYLGNSTVPMSTGVFNYAYTSTSTLGYVFNGALTLPNATYANLVIGGTGSKVLGANTVIGQSFINKGFFDCTGYNLSVSGTFTNNGDFNATSFSSILFTGFAEIGSGITTGFDLRTGDPNVEFRGGMDVHAAGCYTGTGIFSFTTNNQTISFSAYNSGACSANFLVSGAITVTFTSGTTIPNFTGTLNGDNASSTFDCRGTFMYQNATAPMVIGKLYCNQAANTFVYGLGGNQDITVPSDAVPGYTNLTLQGSGAKRLLGDVSVKGFYTLTSSATLNNNGYALTNP